MRALPYSAVIVSTLIAVAVAFTLTAAFTPRNSLVSETSAGAPQFDANWARKAPDYSAWFLRYA